MSKPAKEAQADDTTVTHYPPIRLKARRRTRALIERGLIGKQKQKEASRER